MKKKDLERQLKNLLNFINSIYEDEEDIEDVEVYIDNNNCLHYGDKFYVDVTISKKK